MNIITNIILFQTGWFICIFAVSYQYEWLAIGVMALIIVTHLYLVENWRKDLAIIFITGAVGLLVDSTLIWQKLFIGDWHIAISGLAPLWLIVLWMLFGTTINHSLGWFHKRLALAAVSGSIFAPLAYWAGHRFGALTFPAAQDWFLPLLIISFCWFLITPFLIWLATRLNNTSVTTKHA